MIKATGVLLLLLLSVGCGSTRPIEVWVGEPATRRPYSNVSVEVAYAPWPQWPGWLVWFPASRPEPTEAVTDPHGVATLGVESHRGGKSLIVAGQSFALTPEYLQEGAVLRAPRLYIIVQPPPR